MYSEAELQSAVTAGAISREAAQALRDHANGMRNAPVADEVRPGDAGCGQEKRRRRKHYEYRSQSFPPV